MSKAFNIGEEIWNKKYRFSGNSQVPADKTYKDTWKRIATGVATAEDDNKKWFNEFYSILEDFKFLPAGRIISNTGTKLESVTMFNCYVMNTITDSMEGIFDTVKNAALTQKQGGGVGFDFSTIRPGGDKIKGCNSAASGPISFMQVLDATCKTIMSAGQRRGAQMGVLRCDHPDIEAFIDAKREEGMLTMFNLSVGITEDFMEAVRHNYNWELKFDGQVYKTIKAVDLWDKIMHSTYDYAEPGVLFIDRYNQFNNLHYCETIAACNPCGEQGLPPFGACLLGSLNLTRFVKNPFTSKASIDYDELIRCTELSVRFLDNIIDVSNFPLEEQRQEAKNKRRMGIGITGLANMLIFLQVKYGSQKSLTICKKVMETITHAAYRSSIELAKEKGSFPLFDSEQYLQGQFIKTLPKDIQKGIAEYGIRNSHLTSIAPTGTISLLAGNVSSGLEPVFAYHYTRRIKNTTEKDITEVDICDYAYVKYLEFTGEEDIKDSDLPGYFVSSSDIDPEQHLKVQSTLQQYIDSSISKTINIPVDYPFEKFKEVYLLAEKYGCKGCTTFRPSEFITGVLIKKEDKKKEEVPATQKHEIVKRPKRLNGTTYKITTPNATDALYITINDMIEEDGLVRPFELFINTKNLQHFSWIVAMTRLISAVFRNTTDPRFLVPELKSIYDPNGGYFSEGTYVPSLAADIGRTIEKHLEHIGVIKTQEAIMEKPKKSANDELLKDAMICPMCNEKALIFKEGCMSCLSCNYSKCS